MRDFTDLVHRLKERDPQAMAELYNQFGRLVYSNILVVVRHEAAAEDLTQETFLRIWNSIHSFNCDRGSLGTWIVAVARNRALDYLRSVGGRMERAACDLTQVTERVGD
jgi:RNA polymerase sigma-70 factor, ECF subfamily